MTQTPTYDLVPAEREDIPRLAHIHVIACLPDNAFKLYFATPSDFERRVTEMLEGQVGDSAWQHIKLVDKETGVIAAWASWNFPTAAEIDKRDKQRAAAKASETKEAKEKGKFDFPTGLPTYVQEDTERWMERWTCGVRHMLCKALFTDPMFQRRGMGTTLVEYGNKLADRASLPIFLQASPFGFPIYARHGFETVRHLDVDLREWAPSASSNDKGYGNYRFRYMLRLPRTLPGTS
ncbi:MAG: hypothetical protein LQ338_006305 [Usnochroma carphineum]|nr:MAG: hypothetical protein LQ338_006305 [Usnochroma carphineum]